MIKQCCFALNRLFNLFFVAGVNVFGVVFCFMDHMNEIKDYLLILGLGFFFCKCSRNIYYLICYFRSFLKYKVVLKEKNDFIWKDIFVKVS